jgi:O-antigen/teichoic acid export membrane protein
MAVFQRALRQTGNAVAEATGALATLAAVWILARLDADVLAMLCATLLGSALTLAVSWRSARGLIAFRPRFEPMLWRQYLTMGLPLASSVLLGMLMLRGDTLILSLFKPAADVGLYGIPTKIFELTTMLPYLFAGFMMPLLAAAADSPSRDEFARLLSRAVHATVIYGLATIVALSVFAREILAGVGGSQFASGAHALIILSVGSALAALSTVLRFALIAIDRPRTVLAADGAACAVAFLAYFALIPEYSLTGAAAGKLAGEATVLALMVSGLARAGRSVRLSASAFRLPPSA